MQHERIFAATVYSINRIVPEDLVIFACRYCTSNKAYQSCTQIDLCFTECNLQFMFLN